MNNTLTLIIGLILTFIILSTVRKIIFNIRSKGKFKNININDAVSLYKNNKNIGLIDVRSYAEVQQSGYIKNSINIALDDYKFEEKISQLDKNRELYQKLEDYLIENGVKIITNTKIQSLWITDGVCYGVKTVDNVAYSADVVVVAVGRSGASWLEDQCKHYKIERVPGTMDIGVRVECRNEIMEKIKASYKSYEKDISSLDELLILIKNHYDEYRKIINDEFDEI